MEKAVSSNFLDSLYIPAIDPLHSSFISKINAFDDEGLNLLFKMIQYAKIK